MLAAKIHIFHGTIVFVLRTGLLGNSLTWQIRSRWQIIWKNVSSPKAHLHDVKNATFTFTETVKSFCSWAVVVAQLVERSLPIPESVYRKDENKEKEAGNGPFFKKIHTIHKSSKFFSFWTLKKILNHLVLYWITYL